MTNDTASTPARQELVFGGRSDRELDVANSEIQRRLFTSLHATYADLVLLFLSDAARHTGDYVSPSPEYGYMPALRDADGNAVLLYRFVEVLDGVVDYDAIREDFPKLRYEQIGGALAFLRRVCQFNVLGMDIDAFEDDFLFEHGQLAQRLRASLADTEVVSVLSVA